MVVRDAHPSAHDTQVRNDKDRGETQKVLRGLLSVSDWMRILQAYDEEVEKIGRGTRDNYEEWRAKKEKVKKV